MSKSQTQEKSTDKEVVRSHDLPDGGWGWFVLLGSFIFTLLIPAIGPCFGILFYDPLLEMGANSTLTAWIFNLNNLIINFSMPLSGSLAKEFGWRTIAFASAIITTLSLVLSAFVSTPGYFIFCFSILNGLGSGMAFTCAFMMPPQYFDKHLGKAQSTICMGISVGQLIAPPFIRYLQIEYGFRCATIIIGGIMLHCCVGASLFQPAERHWINKVTPLLPKPQPPPSVARRKASLFMSTEVMSGAGSLVTGINDPRDAQEETKSCNNNRLCSVMIEVGRNMIRSVTALKTPKVVILCLCGTITINSLINFYVFIPFALESAGYSLSDGATCISVGGLGALVTRIIMAPISDRPWFNQRLVYSTGNVVMSLSVLGFTFMGSIWLKYAMMIVFGVGLGMNTTFYLCIMVKYVGLDDLTEVNGASGICVGIGFIILGPLLGMIRDASGSYVLALCIVSALLFLPVLMFLLMPKPQEEEEEEEEQQGYKENA
ncbi:unnamed protein product [Meganyctiphanes norvegica]|uniref:Major facilitator superfamily (MFS) profile domain-containing protein n=1 Tax=Meganyctiphanes norvegica TaxID=48144 RepID=A0AAV2Q2P0_MEGNR